MADARALLRAHRAANRIEHPHAAYSDAGKLLCKLCHEHVKSETLWEGHLRAPTHRAKQAALQQQQQQQQQQQSQTQAQPDAAAPTHKRKHNDADDEDMVDDEAPAAAGDAGRAKRSRTDVVPAPSAATAGMSVPAAGEIPAAAAPARSGTATPPTLSRQASGTPAHGVELAIPSRPATPSLGEGSQNSTPRVANAYVRSPLAGTSGSEAASTPNPTTTATATAEARVEAAANGATPPPASAPARTVDEAEWAAFEAEMAEAAEATPPPPSAVPQPGQSLFAGPGAIAAPALSAAQLAAKSADEEHERRKLQADAQLADEREDATRALEDEFAEMEALESRVQRLKARREALRLTHLRAEGDDKTTTTTTTDKAADAVADKENRGADALANEDDEDDEDEDEDWDDGFRFRA